MDRHRHLGVDIGRVLIMGDDSDADTSLFDSQIEDAVRTPPMDGMFEVLPRLVHAFDGRVWLISKCGPWVQERTLAWLDHHEFYDRTGIDRSHVRFCRRREEKAIHCRELAITDMVDDRIEVHEAVRGVVDRCYLFGPQRKPAPDWVIVTPDWPTAERLLTD